MSYLRIKSSDLYYQEIGEGPLAIFLHAYMTDHTMWLDQMRGLADQRRCVGLDLPGFGRSDPVVPGYLDYDRYADVVFDVIHALGESSADVVAFSAGGTIALELWRRHPDAVRSFVLNTPGVSPGAGQPVSDGTPPEPGERGAPDYLDANALRAVFEGKGVLFDRFQVANYHFGPKASLTAKARYRSMFEGTRTDMMVSTFQTLARGADLSSVPPTITVPVLYLRGTDESMPLEWVTRWLDDVPDATLVHIPESGRFVMLEQPEATTAAIRDFWAARPAATN